MKSTRRRISWVAAALAAGLLLGQVPGLRAAPAGDPRLGLWIECEGRYRTLDDPGRVEAAVAAAEALGATDLFVQVYRNGTAWFSTERASDAPHARARARGFDPLGRTLRLAHARGMRVHAWVNLLRVDDGGSSALVRALGESAVLTDETGVPLTAAGPWGRTGALKPDTPGAWLDPGAPAVADRLDGILRDLLAAHPALDGVHLDYVRYPMPIVDHGAAGADGPGDLGWSVASRKAFLASAGRSGRPPTRARWDAWRRDRLTSLVARIRDIVKDERPGRELSAAVIPSPTEARDRALQDWPAWGGRGLVDLIVPMIYRRDPVVFDALARAALARRGGASMLMGVGAWRFGDDMAAIALRVHIAREAGAQGAVLFSHDNLRSRHASFQRLGALIAAEVGGASAAVPAADEKAGGRAGSRSPRAGLRPAPQKEAP